MQQQDKLAPVCRPGIFSDDFLQMTLRVEAQLIALFLKGFPARELLE